MNCSVTLSKIHSFLYTCFADLPLHMMPIPGWPVALAACGTRVPPGSAAATRYSAADRAGGTIVFLIRSPIRVGGSSFVCFLPALRTASKADGLVGSDCRNR